MNGSVSGKAFRELMVGANQQVIQMLLTREPLS